jgi:hypothetical protein
MYMTLRRFVRGPVVLPLNISRPIRGRLGKHDPILTFDYGNDLHRHVVDDGGA